MLDRAQLLARIAVAAGSSAVVIAVLGTLGAYLGALPGFTTFRAISLAIFTGAVVSIGCGLYAVVKLWDAPAGSGRTLAIAGVVLGVVLLLALALPGAKAAQVPPIHDITTDLDDPPAFEHAPGLTANQGRDMSFPEGPDNLVELHREAYPDLETLVLPVSPDRAYELAKDTIDDLGWRRTFGQKERGVLEALDTTAIFRFIDDIAIRIRPDEASGGSRIDVRSLSRVGNSDLGANAERIRTFLNALQEKAGSASR